MGKKIALFSIISGVLLLTSCAQQGITQRETVKYYQKGRELFKRGDYEGAAKYLEKAQEGLPYLSPAQIAELKYKLALSYYKEGKYTDAILALEDFISNYPTAPQVQEAYLYLIRAYLKISPDPWRDPTYTEKAIELAEEFLQRFPDSPYRSEVYSLLLEAKKKLAKHYYLIAKFYEDYGYYYPAAVWFEYVLITYPDYINQRDALFHYIKNLYLTPRYAEKKISYWKDKYRELKEKMEKNEVEDKEAAERRLQFYKEQMERWKKIAERSVKTADQNLELYKEKYGEDNNYKLLLKIKKGEWKRPWIERIL